MDLATLQRMHPQWNIVDWKEGPQGQGIVAVGADGGVFSLDATGGTTGVTAPFYGSYTQLPADQRQGNRTFSRIDVNQNGGYTLVSNNQEQYNFNAPPPAPLPTVNPGQTTVGSQQATDTIATGDTVSGSAAIHAVLDPLGLGNLADTALTALHGTQGADASYITQVWLPQQKQYKDAFPEIAAAQAKASADPTGGVHIPTPGEIVAFRGAAQQMADKGIIPQEFVTKDKVAQLINGGVSLPEFQSRVMDGYDQLRNSDPAAQAAFLAYHPGVDISHAAASFLDPTLSLAAINRMETQYQIGGAAGRSGFGPITAGQATGLEQAGFTGASSQGQFMQLAGQHALYDQNLVGETPGVNRDTALSSLTSADAAAQLDQRRTGRSALFQGGGGAAGSGQGGQGLGGAGQ